MPNQYLPPVITIPSSLLITAITQSSPMVVSVAIGNNDQANTYIPGMSVRLFVPITYGMFQANNLVGTIKDISGLNWTLDLDSSQFDAFSVPLTTDGNPASISSFGSRNYQYSNTSGPVPFQNLNNIGN